MSLRLFVLAAEKLNISAAGRKLGMAPAVASAKLAKLENSLGADLLHRSTRKVAMSQEGAEFLPYAKEILAQEDAARIALGIGNSTVSGTLRFTAPSTFAQSFIVPLLPKFLQQHPGVKLDLRLSDTEFDLIDGSYDLALRSSSLSDSSLKARKLADDERIFCASPEYLNKHGVPQDLDDLVQHHVVSFRNQTSKQLTGRKNASGQFDPRRATCKIVVDDGLSLKIATLAGAGISMNSIWSVYQELRDGTLIQVLPDFEFDDQIALWLIYPKSNVLTAKVRVFIDFLLQEIGKAPPWTNA